MRSMPGRSTVTASKSGTSSQPPRLHTQAACLQHSLQTQPQGARHSQHVARADGPSKAQDAGVQLDRGAAQPTSPFSQATVHREVGNSAAGSNELTQENVDRVLNEIRGYLFADGGDIEVVKVEDGKVYVKFQGNCASCGSQETTMTMGVERSLRAAFGSSLKEIVRMDPPELKKPAGATVESINTLLDLLRPAIESYGGSVTAQSMQDGVCTVQYDGPDAIWNGVRSAIKDRFEDVTEVQRA